MRERKKEKRERRKRRIKKLNRKIVDETNPKETGNNKKISEHFLRGRCNFDNVKINIHQNVHTCSTVDDATMHGAVKEVKNITSDILKYVCYYSDIIS